LERNRTEAGGRRLEFDSLAFAAKRSGSTGSIGPNPAKQLPVTKSVVSGDKATIEAAIPNRDARLVITVQRDGDKLSGELKQIGAAAEETIGAFKASRE
jgi:hypothetical protein